MLPRRFEARLLVNFFVLALRNTMRLAASFSAASSVWKVCARRGGAAFGSAVRHSPRGWRKVSRRGGRRGRRKRVLRARGRGAGPVTAPPPGLCGAGGPILAVCAKHDNASRGSGRCSPDAKSAHLIVKARRDRGGDVRLEEGVGVTAQRAQFRTQPRSARRWAGAKPRGVTRPLRDGAPPTHPPPYSYHGAHNGQGRAVGIAAPTLVFLNLLAAAFRSRRVIIDMVPGCARLCAVDPQQRRKDNSCRTRGTRKRGGRHSIAERPRALPAALEGDARVVGTRWRVTARRRCSQPRHGRLRRGLCAYAYENTPAHWQPSGSLLFCPKR